MFYAIHAWNIDFDAWKSYAIIFKIIYFKSIHPFSTLVKEQLYELFVLNAIKCYEKKNTVCFLLFWISF